MTPSSSHPGWRECATGTPLADVVCNAYPARSPSLHDHVARAVKSLAIGPMWGCGTASVIWWDRSVSLRLRAVTWTRATTSVVRLSSERVRVRTGLHYNRYRHTVAHSFAQVPLRIVHTWANIMEAHNRPVVLKRNNYRRRSEQFLMPMFFFLIVQSGWFIIKVVLIDRCLISKLNL